MTTDPVPRRRERCSVEWMDHEALIYRRPAEMAIYLNETATVIWRLCDGARTVKEIVDILVDAFPEAAADVRADVKETIDELVRNGALQLSSPQEAGAASAADADSSADARND
jgi:pyrroloquinoline quinone biosynthesis protein D